MIHHLSIPARDTRHTADVLAELFGGVVTGFGPYRNSWIAWAGDDHEGWRALRLTRGPFDVIEFWIENTVMLELMTPDMADDYRTSTPRTTHTPR